jgi:hypothetical protein
MTFAKDYRSSELIRLVNKNIGSLCVCETPCSLINTKVCKNDLGISSSYASEGRRERRCCGKPTICCSTYVLNGPGSSVGIATELRTGRAGNRISVGERFSAPVQTGPEAHTASCTMGTGSFPGVRCGRGVKLTPHPLLVPRSKIE